MKKEILKKALYQFQKHGIREMSNQKLVEILGISTKTIYKYFKNKEGLLEEVLYLYHAQQQEMLKSLPPEKNAASLFFDIWNMAVTTDYDVNNTFFKDIKDYYPELERKIHTAVRKKYTQVFLRIIQRGLEEGTFRMDIIPEVVLESIILQYEVIARSEQFKRFRLPAEDLMLNTIAITIRGVCTVKGGEVLDKHIQTQQLLIKVKKPYRKTPVNPP